MPTSEMTMPAALRHGGRLSINHWTLEVRDDAVFVDMSRPKVSAQVSPRQSVLSLTKRLPRMAEKS